MTNNMTAHLPVSQRVQHTPIMAHKPVIKILGLGGGGSNAVNRLLELGLQDVEFIAANTDIQALRNSLAPKKIQLGPRLTRGLGAGGNPSVGEAAAEESHKEIAAALAGADMVFLTAGMGGGTGTGSIGVAARIAREIGAVTVAVVTTPFSFEVGRRQKNAREGLTRLQPHTDTLITVPNDRLLNIAPKSLTLDLAFQLADDVLRQGIQGIAELITIPGLINVDFAHIRQVMKNGGGALLSIGIGEGENKAMKAVEQALHHPLLESVSIENATGIIANFTGGEDLSFVEVTDALNHLQGMTHWQADIIPGVISDPRMDNRTQVILVITGLGATPIESAMPMPVRRAQPETAPVEASPAQVSPMEAVQREPMRMPANRPPAGYIPNTAAHAAPQMAAQGQSAQQQPGALQSAAAAATTREMTAAAQGDLDLPAFLRRRVRQ